MFTALLLLSSGQSTFLPYPYDSVAMDGAPWTVPALYSYSYPSKDACAMGNDTVSLTVFVPVCNPAQAKQIRRSPNPLVSTFEVSEGKCALKPSFVSPFTASEPDVCEASSYGDGGAITWIRSDLLPVGVFDPWATPEAVHRAEMEFDSSVDCSGIPVAVTFIPGRCITNSDGSSTSLDGNSKYTVYQEQGCKGTSTPAFLPASENGACTKTGDTSSSLVITTWFCPAGFEHDHAKIANRRQLRQLHFGSFKMKMPQSPCKAL
ncbi:hypothetical protein T492DRAFT_954645 [Pavlovales sp. CCMP2436]|nr:hypothetical protein T492DRAFT_954645 [Pavlovales sp. CCMP2436]